MLLSYIDFLNESLSNDKDLNTLIQIAKTFESPYDFDNSLNRNKFGHDRKNSFLRERFTRLNRGTRLEDSDKIYIYRAGDSPIVWGDYVYLNEDDANHAFNSGQGNKVYQKLVRMDDVVETSVSGEYYYSPKNIAKIGEDLIEFWYFATGKKQNESIILESKKLNKVIVYHFSNQLKHMLNSDFDIGHSRNTSIFGKAIYFSSSPDIKFLPMNAGKKTFCCKFELTLEEPLLDMNRLIPVYEANRLLKDFKIIVENKEPNKIYDYFNYDFEKNFLETIQMGEFFDKIYITKYFDFFIHKYLGYNSFQYFQNSRTDYITQKGDYGISYGVYDKKNIKYVDGPF